MHIQVPSRFAGPPAMGHGGYVAGLLAERHRGAVQVTLRRPIPLDADLELHDLGGGHVELRQGEDVLVASEPSSLQLDVPAAPSIDAARAAEAGSPSHDEPNGVHPTCFGCGKLRDPGDALRIFAGPLEVGGHHQVAGVWRPEPALAEPDGHVATRWVLAALDCPGAFAFITGGVRAGLLGRITSSSARTCGPGPTTSSPAGRSAPRAGSSSPAPPCSTQAAPCSPLPGPPGSPCPRPPLADAWRAGDPAAGWTARC